jgi:CPA2 family monovalent cation:H+ antiporter-2
MAGDVSLLSNVAIALAAAFAGGFVARFLRLPSLIGYIAAGVAISPLTPGYSVDLHTLEQVAELGVIFLMFGIGLNFDLADLRAVQKAAVPGGLVLMAALGSGVFGIAVLSGLDSKEAIVVGLAVCVCSSAVLSRSLEDQGFTDSIPGRLAIGWSVVEDLVTVIILAVLPSLAGDNSGGEAFGDAGSAVARAVAFVALTLIVGPRIIPWLLRTVARAGSRELFILGVVAIALGIATGGAELFDVSIAIGAFVAGVVISETEMGHQATADVLPLREAFAVLFFVSVGMLLDPEALGDDVPLLLAIVAAVTVGVPMAVLLIFAALPHPGRTALVVGVSLAQFGEFSFLIAQEGLDLALVSDDTYNVILGASVLTIAVNPLLFRVLPAGERSLARTGPVWRLLERQGAVPGDPEPQSGHVVILGYGRVGELTGHALASLQLPRLVVEADLGRAHALERAGQPVIWGDAGSRHVLDQAGIDRARLVVIALPDENSTVLAMTNVREIAPGVPIVVRARVREELEILRRLGAAEVVVPEYEGGLELMSQALIRLGYPTEEAEAYRLAIRDITYESATE